MCFQRQVLLLRQMGVWWVVFRLYYYCVRKLGLMRMRCRIQDLGDVIEAVGNKSRSKHMMISSLSSYVGDDAVSQANLILEGSFSLYSHHLVSVGFPPVWNRNCITGEVFSGDRHWSELDDFSQGDIKNVWELSRFDWVFPLVRAYVRTKDAKYYEGFRSLLNSWIVANPPNVGPNWKCGQEVALRVRAAYIAMIGFHDALDADEETEVKLRALCCVSANRINANLSYALSQDSNHGHTELLGLLLASLMLPEETTSQCWIRSFEKHIERVVERLNFEGGGCCMYSMVYHRMMLDCMVLMVSVTRRFEYELPEILNVRLGQAANLLYELVDLEHGTVPLFGSNDGSRILPLSSTDYYDYRSLLQTLFWITGDKRSFGRGPWNEPLAWLGASDAEIERLEAVFLPSQKRFHDASDSGLVSIREGDLQLFVRAGRQKYRPGHLDHLSLLMKWKGQDILVAPGTYSYNAPSPFDHLFKDTCLQNTAFVEGYSQMTKVSRFLAVPWLSSSVIDAGPNRIDLEFKGFPDVEGGACHRRSITWASSRVVIEDAISTIREFRHGVHWLLPSFETCERVSDCFKISDAKVNVSIRVDTPCGSDLKCVVESADGRWGYRSRYYQQVEAARSLVALSPPSFSSRFKTVIELSEA